ncbi:MAG TPA: hypothetical protein VK711_10490 [Puia sp.]|jgi:hypothetical protein|nr:hypothetical protein [Puia sp.]
MIRSVIACIIFIVFLQGCGFNGSYFGTWKNLNISQDKRAEIEVLNRKLINSIKFNDVVAVKSIMSDTVKKVAGNEIDSLISRVSPAFTSDRFTILDEYYVHNLVSGISVSLKSNLKTDDDYTIAYNALNKETYTSLLLVYDPTGEVLVTVVYGNYDGNWEINILQIGQYRYYYKNAMDYYRLAKLNYDQGYFVDAADNLLIANQCLKPADKIFKYKKEGEVKAFYDKVIKETLAKYNLPLTLENIPSKPKVFGIYPQLKEGGYYNTFRYLSSINIDDSIALAKENKKVRVEVKKIFTGVGIYKKITLYQAFNEMPDGNNPTKYYGFIDR